MEFRLFKIFEKDYAVNRILVTTTFGEVTENHSNNLTQRPC
jgi:hypothetical protein